MNTPQASHVREATGRVTAATADGTFEEATPIADSASGDRWVFRIGGWAAIAGAILGLIGNLIHPVTPINDPEGVARVIADSGIWVPVHLAIVFGIFLMLGGLIAIYHSIRGGVVHIVDARVSPPGPVQADSAGTFRFRPLGRSRFTMTEFEPPRSWTWRGRAIGVTLDYEHRFEAVSPEMTRLVWVVRSRSRSRAGVRARLFALVYSRLLDRAIPRFVASVSPPPADPAARMSRHQAIDSGATSQGGAP